MGQQLEESNEKPFVFPRPNGYEVIYEDDPVYHHRWGTRLGMQGRKVTAEPFFRSTSFETWTPISRFTYPQEPRTDVKEELERISAQELAQEPFQVFFKHIDILTRFASPNIVANMLPTILERVKNDATQFAKEVEKAGEETAELNKGRFSQETTIREVSMRVIACLDRCEDANIDLPPSTVEHLYKEALNNNPRYLSYALTFDEKNKMKGNSIEITDRVKAYLKSELIHPKKENTEKINNLLDWTYPEAQLLSELLTSTLVDEDCKGDLPKNIAIVQRLSQIMGVENIRKRLRAYAKDNESFRPTFQAIFQHMGLDRGKEMAIDLGDDVYGKTPLKFDEYGPYKDTGESDVETLVEECEKTEAKTICEAGCGTGRIMKQLQKDLQNKGITDVQLAGFDLLETDIQAIQQQHPEINVLVGNWFAAPFEPESFDLVYCIGRSITHNTTIPDMVMCLQQLRKIIKINGRIITDIPDATSGEFITNIKETATKAQEQGVANLLPGTINDSPDKLFYFDRYIPDESAYIAICKLSGLEAKKLPKVAPYQGVTGKMNLNTYWELTPIDPPKKLRAWEKVRLFQDIYKKRPKY